MHVAWKSARTMTRLQNFSAACQVLRSIYLEKVTAQWKLWRVASAGGCDIPFTRYLYWNHLPPGDEITEERSMDSIANPFPSGLAFERWVCFLGGVFLRETSRGNLHCRYARSRLVPTIVFPPIFALWGKMQVEQHGDVYLRTVISGVHRDFIADLFS